MKIRMLEDAIASENGIDINEYKAGQEYDILGAIGYSFIKRKLAEPIEEVKDPVTIPEAPDKPGHNTIAPPENHREVNSHEPEESPADSEDNMSNENNEQPNEQPNEHPKPEQHGEKKKQPHQNKALKGAPENKSQHGAK